MGLHHRHSLRSPRQWCAAQRIQIIMIAGGNHTIILCALARNDNNSFPYQIRTAPGYRVRLKPRLMGRVRNALGPARRCVNTEFLYKNAAGLKVTRGKKVENPPREQRKDYVNHIAYSHLWGCCGKLLWKNLWRMWKTSSYQQVSQGFPQGAAAVEKNEYPSA